MTPQKQRYRDAEDEGQFGDCHRTCIAMILDLPRDEVPHFMDGVPASTPDGDPAWEACAQAERDWLAARGLVYVSIPFAGGINLYDILGMLATTAKGAAVILGCTSGNGVNHSVVVYDGEIYNPNDGYIVGPMRDGFWWLTIYAAATKPLPPQAAPASVVIQEDD